MAFPPELFPLCPEQMTAYSCMCPKLGKGQVCCLLNKGNVCNGQSPPHSALCFEPSSFSFSFETLGHSKRNVVHVFLIHLHLNH